MSTTFETQWVRFIRENKYLRESFFKFMGELREEIMERFPNASLELEFRRLQGKIQTIDFITQFVSHALGKIEDSNAGRTNGHNARAEI